MSRFEKKCFVGSAALHGLLLATFLFSSAFLNSKPQNTAVSVITILPLDTKAYGKPEGNPDPPAPAQAKPAPEQPTPEPPKPPEAKPEPVKPPEVVKTPEVVKKEVEKRPEPVKKEPGELPTTKPLKKQEVTQKDTAKSSLLTPARRTNELAKLQREKEAKAAQEADRKYRQEVAKLNEQRGMALAAAREAMGIGKSLSKSTVVNSIGVDTSGGSVSGRYGDRLKAIYDARWTLSHDLSDDESVACVSVVIARDGTVKSHKITRPSGNAAFDRSVRQVLEAVRTVQPFPAEMKDSEREFTWRFERKLRAG